MRSLVVILGVPVDCLSFKETLEKIDHYVQVGRSTRKVHQVATVNTDFLVKAAGDPQLRRLLQSVHLATPDGMPLLWAARMLGSPLQERVTGADLVPAIAELSAKKGYSIYLLGAAPGVAHKAGQILQQRYPGLRIVGVASPPYAPIHEMDRGILDEIRAAQPDILLVAFGNPKQEKWIEMYGHHVGVPVIMGVGGSLDFIAGNIKRAPAWMQKTGLEWLYRLLQEPRRLWRRYGVDLVVFTRLFARQWWHLRGEKGQEIIQPSIELVLTNGKAVLNVRGKIGKGTIENLKKMGRQALAVTPEILMNVSRVDFVDSAGAGTLVELTNQARDGGGELTLVSVPPGMKSTLAILGLGDFFRLSEMTNHPETKPAIA